MRRLLAVSWQYIVSGVQDPRFRNALGDMITDGQAARINEALAPIMARQVIDEPQD